MRGLAESRRLSSCLEEDLDRQLRSALAERHEASRRLMALEAQLALLQETLHSSEAQHKEALRRLEELLDVKGHRS